MWHAPQKTIHGDRDGKKLTLFVFLILQKQTSRHKYCLPFRVSNGIFLLSMIYFSYLSCTTININRTGQQVQRVTILTTIIVLFIYFKLGIELFAAMTFCVSFRLLCFVSFTARFGNTLTCNLPPANQLQNKKTRMYHYQNESDKEDKQLKMRWEVR